jgi:hypothetical protein
MSEFEERFDGMFLNITQQSQVYYLFHLIKHFSHCINLFKGIEPLLDNLFSFLRRKTDFFVGAPLDKIEELVLKVIKKQHGISEKVEADKKKAKEKEEKLKKQKAEKKKKVLFYYFIIYCFAYITINIV